MNSTEANNAGDLQLVAYEDRYRADCLALFDANCPEYFAPNERADFEMFLAEVPASYRVCLKEGKIVAAFGLSAASTRGRINWIMVHPATSGGGVGRQMMTRLLEMARQSGIAVLDIAASHLSAAFFAKFGAVELKRIENGWGPAMHRVDMELILEGE